MDYGIRSGKSLTLGCPRHPKVILKDNHVTPTMLLYLPRVGARLRGIAAW